MKIMFAIPVIALSAAAADLPARYFQLMSPAIDEVGVALANEPGASLQNLESRRGWRHFPSAVLVGAVLYAKQHAANPKYRDPKVLAATVAVGDLLASEHEKGTYNKRLDHHRDTYMWLDAYRLLEPQLGEARRDRWRRALVDNMTSLAPEVQRRQNFPWFNSPYIITSPNHYSLWSSMLYLAGRTFGNREWENLGYKVMHRFAAEEQTPDGYWGEHSRDGPTTGYDYLTMTAVALFWEHSRDQAALAALRRSTDFHKYYTWPDGTPVEIINDRNRYWEVSMWGSFGFSNFPDGRRYAEFLADAYGEERMSLEALGRMAQNALYYHEGPKEKIPQDEPNYRHRMNIPAGIRKTGPWTVCLSGIISTQTLSRFYLDRQGSLSVFHEKLGLIITGANSKRQPELASFSEKIRGQVYHLPLSSRLDMAEDKDTLALAYNSFFSVMEVPAPSQKELAFRYNITPTGSSEGASLNLQLCLKPGQALETGGGKKLVLGAERIELAAEEIGGWIRHNGWTLKPDPRARLVWPVQPFNPYGDGPEKGLARAVGALSVPFTRGQHVFSFAIEAN
jgi:hypothetical protein